MARLQDFWNNAKGKTVPAALADDIVETLNGPALIEPVVHCYVEGGLLDDRDTRSPRLNEHVHRMLEDLEKNGRTVVLIAENFAPHARANLHKAGYQGNWEIRLPMDMIQEFDKRSMDVQPKAELMISPHDDDTFALDRGAHAYTLTPSQLRPVA